VNYEDTSDGFRINFPQNKVASSSGVNFRATPGKIFPADAVSVAYDVYLPEDFPWVRGGKIGPGLCIGLVEGDCVGGGEQYSDKASVRIMWLPDGYASLYVYFPTTAMSLQGKRTAAIVENPHLPYTHLFRQQKTLQFKAGQWNSIEMTVQMNTVGQQDGVLELNINGHVESVHDCVFRTDPNMKIQSLFFASWFGGSDVSTFAPPFDTYSIIKNIYLKKL
jgi:hypothetical protein